MRNFAIEGIRPSRLGHGAGNVLGAVVLHKVLQNSYPAEGIRRCGQMNDSEKFAQNTHTVREWQIKFFAMGAKCYYCETPLLLKDAEREHRTPKCRGGLD